VNLAIYTGILLRQVGGQEHAFIVNDNIGHGWNKKLPLWLFGFLY